MSGQLTKPVPFLFACVSAWLLVAIGAEMSPPRAFAEDKPAEAPPAVEPPQVIVATPLGAIAGETTKITLRGLRMDNATAVKLPELGEQAQIKFISAGKAAVPNGQNAAQVGDTEVVFDLKLPQGVAIGKTPLVVVGPAGESQPLGLLIDSLKNVVNEKEPNDGLKQSQQIQVGQTVAGLIHEGKNVDVFRFHAEANQTITCEIMATQLGSPADLQLMLFTPAGQLLATCDDVGDQRDPSLKARLPQTGDYLVVVMESQDSGGNNYPYRLTIRK